MASHTSLHFLLLPSSYGIPPFLKRFSFSGVFSTLVRMHVPGIIRLVRAHGTMNLAELHGWIRLIDWLYCSQEDISRGHGLRRPELCWEGCILYGSANSVYR